MDNLDKIVHHLLNKCTYSLLFLTLDLNLLSMVAYSDVSDNMNVDLSFYPEFIEFLIDENKVNQTTHRASSESKLVPRSTLKNKFMVFYELFDIPNTIK